MQQKGQRPHTHTHTHTHTQLLLLLVHLAFSHTMNVYYRVVVYRFRVSYIAQHRQDTSAWLILARPPGIGRQNMELYAKLQKRTRFSKTTIKKIRHYYGWKIQRIKDSTGLASWLKKIIAIRNVHEEQGTVIQKAKGNERCLKAMGGE